MKRAYSCFEAHGSKRRISELVISLSHARASKDSLQGGQYMREHR